MTLPDIAKQHISTYLPKLYRITLHVISTTNERRYLNNLLAVDEDQNRNSASLTHVDFTDLGKTLANTLTDDNVCNILKYINAKHNVKRINIAYLWGIKGSGLEPLRGSTSLETIDLSMVPEFMSPDIALGEGYTSDGDDSSNSTDEYGTSDDDDDESDTSKEDDIGEEDVIIKLSESLVYPIVESIFNAKGTSLEYVALPKLWRKQRSDLSSEFLDKLNKYLTDKKFDCHHCTEWKDQQSHFPPWVRFKRDSRYGILNGICYGCNGKLCYHCETDPTSLDGTYTRMTLWDYCQRCEKEFCYKCQPLQRINGEFPKCHNRKCKKRHCNGCNYNICKVEGTWDICGKAYCSQDCMDSEYESFDTCGICKRTGCSDCVHTISCAVEGCNKSNCWDCAEKFCDEGHVVMYCDCQGTTCLDHITEIVIEEELEMRRGDCADAHCYECRGRAFSKIFKKCEKLRAQMKEKDQAALNSIANINKGPGEACEESTNTTQPKFDTTDERVLPSSDKEREEEAVVRSENNCAACHMQEPELLKQCFAPQCGKPVCKHCAVAICDDCGRSVCSDACKKDSSYWHVRCGGCNKLTCDGCCEGIVECNLCAKSNCGNCVNKLSEYKKKKFRQCNHDSHYPTWTYGKKNETNFDLGNFCSDCGMERMKEKIRAGQDECIGCKGLLFSELYDEYQDLQKVSSLNKVS